MRLIKYLFLSSFFTLSIDSLAHEPEVTRKTICETKGTNIYFMKVSGSDLGDPQLPEWYVKIWREQAGVDFFTIHDPLNLGLLNTGICGCSLKEPRELTCD